MDRLATTPQIRLDARPRIVDLLQFWQILHADSSCRHGVYMDTFPWGDMAAFFAPMLRDEMLFWLVLVDEQVAGAHWLHDLMDSPRGRTAWFATYYAPAWRGQLAPQAFHLFMDAAAAAGIVHVFGGHRPRNEGARRMGQKCGLTYAGEVKEFGWFEGRLDTLCVYSWRPEGTALALLQAEHRASIHRARPPC